MTTVISLLRGINVGGNKQIKMADLKALFEKSGYTDVKTLLQSGNVVCRADESQVTTMPQHLESAIQTHFGFEVKLITFPWSEFQQVIQTHPFSPEQLADPGKILVMFLQNELPESGLQPLLEAYSGPEAIYPGQRVIYLHYPEGSGRSKLTHALIERKLKFIGTARNWNTVTKLASLAENL
jgi:uncharacterized protein (DUF1697 family)